MLFSIEQESLVTPLQLVSGAVEKRQTLPVLSNILIRVEDGLLVLTATDLEVEISAQVPLENEYTEGDITVPARKFLDICRSLSPDKPIEVKLDESRLKISSGRSRFSLSTIAAQEFPNIEDSVYSSRFTLDTQVLKQLIDRTQFAMAHQDVRYYLNGMLFEINGDKLVSVATDGHRLALSRHQLDTPASDELIQAIIPRKGVLEIGKILNSGGSECEIALSQNHLQVKIGQYLLTTKLIDGRFPDYEKVLPKNVDRIAVGGREQLRDAFSRASILCNEKFRGVRLGFSQNKLAIHANNPEQEEAEIEIDVDFTDADLEIGFNVGYLMDALSAIKSDSVRFNLGDSNSSVLLESSESSDSLYVVMPMRL